MINALCVISGHMGTAGFCLRSPSLLGRPMRFILTYSLEYVIIGAGHLEDALPLELF